MPESRAAWARALAHEVQAIADDRAALAWALGGIWISYRERIELMHGKSLFESRWILALEMLVCFVPLTLLGIAIVTAAATSRMVPFDALLYLSATTVGPIGLIVAFRTVLLGRPPASRIGLLVLGVFAAWTLTAYLLSMLNSGISVAAWWREAVLLALLPAAGAGHLAWLTMRRPDERNGTDLPAP